LTLIKLVFVAVFSFCTVCALLSGCTTQMSMKMMYNINPKVIKVNQSWINKFAKQNKTKDVDILHKLCKPTYITEYSNGEKSYTYMAVKDDTYKESNLVTFFFNQNHTLKKALLKETAQSKTVSPPKSIASDKDLLAFLEALPSNPTRQILEKILGKPRRVESEESNIIYMTYLFIMKDAYGTKDYARYIPFKIKSNGKVEYMIIPKTFYDFAKKNHAHFNVKTIYRLEREINEEEAAAIEKCE